MNLSHTAIERALQAIVAAKLQIASDQVPLDRSLTDDLGLDSFDVVTVILEIEERFPRVTLSNKSAEKLRTLREVAAYIDEEMTRSSRDIPTPG